MSAERIALTVYIDWAVAAEAQIERACALVVHVEQVVPVEVQISRVTALEVEL